MFAGRSRVYFLNFKVFLFGTNVFFSDIYTVYQLVVCTRDD